MPGGEGVDPRLAEARRLAAEEQFLEPPAARPRFSGGRNLVFDSPLPSPDPENNAVHGRFYPCPGQWRGRPAVVLVHGWNDFPNHCHRFPRLAKKLNEAGVNAATLELPYQFQRRPRRLGAHGNILSPDIARTVRNATQAVADIRALARWLAEEGCPRLGVLGVSMGGWLGGLAACHDPRFETVALIVPVARLDRMLQEAAFCEPLRRSINGQKIELGRMSLFAARPCAPNENVLVVEAEHDLFVPSETLDELAQTWGGPEVWRLGVGHISVLGVPGLTRRLSDWLAARLGGDGEKQSGCCQDKIAKDDAPPWSNQSASS